MLALVVALALAQPCAPVLPPGEARALTQTVVRHAISFVPREALRGRPVAVDVSQIAAARGVDSASVTPLLGADRQLPSVRLRDALDCWPVCGGQLTRCHIRDVVLPTG